MSDFRNLGEKRTVTERNDTHNSPGEYIVILIFFIGSCAVLFESFKSKGVIQGELSGPGALPQIMLFLTCAMIIALTIQLVRKHIRPAKFNEVIHYLLCKNNIFLILAVCIYGILLEWLHFRLATMLFLFVCMYMFERKRPLQKLLISIITVIILELIFSTIFKVILP